MATFADQRLLDLLDKWLKSLELHAKYSVLDDDSYRKMQAWPEHQRPSRWIIDLAMQKAVALKTQVEERVKMGDAKFSDSLELMTFLANLLGSQHIERFIPVAEPAEEHTVESAPPENPAPSPPAVALTGTREMPKFLIEKAAPRAPAAAASVARSERKPSAKPVVKPTPPPKPVRAASPAKAAAKATAVTPPSPVAESPKVSPDSARDQVIADAARLVQWGRKWYELAELIARMADRPSLTDVRRILKDNKTLIENKAGRG